jgi:NAD(P)-dependent dehydrogenase (short-subunit alcohol dehydrogenase family)
MKHFKNKVAVVTGAARGIGRGMAEVFVEADMKVVLADVDETGLQSTVNALNDAGARVLGVATDVSQPGQVRQLANKTLDTFGAVHVLCNNAGVGYGGQNSWEIPLETWQWVMGVNLMGAIYGIHTFLPIMLEQETEGHIVNTSSIAGLVANGINIPYGVSKHALVALTESLHLELMMQGANIKVSLLCPGNVNTDIMESSLRNRPADVPPPPDRPAEEAVFVEAYKTWVARGLDPKMVGQQVLGAIKEERLYVVTTNDFDEHIQQRMTSILDRKNLGLSEPPESLMDILKEIIG